ncbi:hypothetical protein [Mangrovibacterium marinum]|uniref:Uncharacterized protein n=1 Tax=Mangrovibacterium marinum TaxID=1639118 RepID=A0A2T5BTT5_9BACT|nr:hypothetical protein [Mangrovibacterium marinum]PTN02888.1 hypothetical protein C8N47_13718 [Mangrovibacterium marinum]
MATVIINEKTKAGKALLEYLRASGQAIVIEKSVAVNSVSKGLAELDQVKKGKKQGTPARKFLSDL